MAKDLIASAADILNAPAYQGLLGRTLPRVIRTEAENQHYLDLLYQLDAHSNDLTAPEKAAMEQPWRPCFFFFFFFFFF